MSGGRFIFASAILFVIGRLRGESLPTPRQRPIALTSGLMLVLANALVGYAEKSVATGLASVVVGTVPVWIMLMQWLIFKGLKPTLRQVVGIASALMGVVFLTSNAGSSSSSLIGLLVLLLSVIVWSLGTLIQRQAALTGNVFYFSGFQLFWGGIFTAFVGFIFERPDPSVFTTFEPGAFFAFAYLVIFGSVVAFSAYVWLNMHVEPAKVSTYALVNPLVAIWLGWLFNDETVYATMIFSSVLIVVGLYLVLFRRMPWVARGG